MKSESDASATGLADTRRGQNQAMHDVAALATLVCDSPWATLAMPGLDVARHRGGARADGVAEPIDRPFDAYVLESTDLFEVPDVAADERFSATIPLIAGRSVAFYAGMPVIAADGRVLGALAVLDFIPRRLDPEQRAALSALARQAAALANAQQRDAKRMSLHRAETLFRDTFEQAPIGIAFASRDARFLRCNRAFCDMLGFSASELATKSIRELTCDADAVDNTTEIARLWQGEIDFYTQEKRYLRANGSVIWTRVTATLVRDEDGTPTCSVGFVQDITGRREMEAALLRNQNLLATVIADVPVAIMACDVAGQIILHNRVADNLFAIAPADDSSRGAPEPYPIGVEAFLPDGVTRVPREQRPLARALRGETVNQVELVAARPGREARMTVNSARQLVGPNGECLGAVGVTQDVTAIKALERELAQAQKLESIGQLSAGIAHEINTPTQYIGDNIRFIQETFQQVLGLVGKLAALAADHTDGMVPVTPIAAELARPDVSYWRDEIPKAIAQSLEGIARIAKIVSAMKEFSHPGLEKTPVDLNHAIVSTITVASNEWKYIAEVRTDFDPSLPAVSVIPGAFNQVILNILVNAAHAVRAAVGESASRMGTISVATRRIEDWAEIRIADTGCGIPAKILARIFDPFFTTKPLGKGTGQGLAIAHDVVVKKLGGTISVNSEPGVGTTFTLRLPLDTPAGGDAAAAAA